MEQRIQVLPPPLSADRDDGGRAAAHAAYPLSFAQQRLWFLEQLAPGTPLYNIPRVLRLSGSLKVAALEAALRRLSQRHASLRTSFASRDGEAVQVVATAAVPVLDLVDLGEAAEDRIAAAVQAHIRRPFDLTRGPLLRATLLQSGPQRYLLILVIHHIIADGWSMGVLLRELSALYTAELGGQAAALPELPVQYPDYALWQRRYLQGAEVARQLAYWKRQLAGAPVLELPTDRPRPPVQRFHGASHRFRLGPALTGAAKLLGQRFAATPYMVLLAAFQLLLARYSGQTDIVVGSPIAGRTRRELEGLIGFFVNTIALRVDLAGVPTFRELVARVRTVALEAYTHQELPFEKLVEELLPHRDLSRNPLVQVMFALQNIPAAEFSLPGLSIESVPATTGTAKCDLILMLTESGGELRGSIDYNTDLFDAITIERMVAHFQVLLEGAIAEPERPVTTLPMLSAAEREQQLGAWNATATDYPRQASLPALFAAQAVRRAEAIAVVDGERTLTYGELDVGANRLAHYLRGRGIGRGVPVGLCLARSADVVVAVLGILKAGGAYVPLDPAHPAERLAFMLADSGAPVLVTASDQLGRFPDYGGVAVCLDRERTAIAAEPLGAPAVALNGDDLAYVIYTSGSTGTPKGVAVPQRAVTRLVLNSDYVRLQSSDAVAQAANCAFDAATFEIWGALLCGARLVILSQETVLWPRGLADAVRRERITTLFLTTALFNQIAQEEPTAFAPLTHLLFGGEAVDLRWVRKVLQQGAPRRLLHVYGPTENTTFSTWHLVREVAQDDRTVPIGRPIANSQAYILDNALQPVPVGAIGELYLGGDGLASGYHNDAALTAARFVAHPFDGVPGARLYRTGDLARYRPDGAIEFVGRVDHQVKLRGFRIELGEIETALGHHPRVTEAVVSLHRDENSEQRLVAYCAGERIGCDDEAELRHFLAQRLPEFMVPATFVFLERLPLNANGKVDRKSLPAPIHPPASAVDRVEGPRDGLEARLLGIWQRLLCLDTIGVHDDFFAAGGHSLLGVRLVAEVERATGRRLPLTVLFQQPTIAGLATVLRGGAPLSPLQALVPVRLGGRRPPFFFVYGRASALAPHLDPEQPFYWFNWLQHGDGSALVSTFSVRAIAASHVRELRTVQPTGPYLLGGFSFGGVVALEMAQQLRRQGDEVALLALFDPTSPALGRRRPASPSGWLSKAKQRGQRWADGVRQMACWYYRIAKRPLPPRVNIVRLRHLGYRASLAYDYPSYPYPITLFLPEATHGAAVCADAVRRTWDGIAAGGLEIQIIGGSKRHIDLVSEPFIRDLAERLDGCLRRATGADP